MKKKEENIDIKGESIEIKKLSFLPIDQDYLIKLIGGEAYNQLLDACFQWDKLFIENSVDFASLTNRQKVISDMLENKNFKTIIEMHNKIKALQEESEKGIIPFLIDFIQHQQYDFLIPHMFLTGKVLEGYDKVHFNFLGFPADIAKAIEYSIYKLDTQETEIIGGSDDN